MKHGRQHGHSGPRPRRSGKTSFWLTLALPIGLAGCAQGPLAPAPRVAAAHAGQAASAGRAAERLPSTNLVANPVPTVAVDWTTLWDYNDPALSEQRFRAALPAAAPDLALILHTQIARTKGLRRDFVQAREILAGLQPQLATASAEARIRHALEWGRTYASGRHRGEERTPEAAAEARKAWQHAWDLARAEGLDGLAIDAIHMFAFIDTAPVQQQHWAEQALAVSLASSQPAATRWEASIRNNLGHALEQQNRHAQALQQYQLALALRERGHNASATHVARYMVARSLRLQGRHDEALVLQQRLQRDAESAGKPDPYVLDELALLHRARGDAAQADAAAEQARRARAAGGG